MNKWMKPKGPGPGGEIYGMGRVGDEFPCELCESVYYNKLKYDAHMIISHQKYDFVCGCGKAFPFRFLLEKHKRRCSRR